MNHTIKLILELLGAAAAGSIITVAYYEASVALFIGRKLVKTAKGDIVAALIHIAKFQPFSSLASSVKPPDNPTIS